MDATALIHIGHLSVTSDHDSMSVESIRNTRGLYVNGKISTAQCVARRCKNSNISATFSRNAISAEILYVHKTADKSV